jgi:hypothetical protein
VSLVVALIQLHGARDLSSRGREITLIAGDPAKPDVRIGIFWSRSGCVLKLRARER